MAKSGRKRKKAEKSKTKLRQSIKLPKGLNETKATVKSKAITVLNQLRSQDTEEDKKTKKKIGIRDLMSKLNNNGMSTKLEGLEGLQELLKAYPELCEEFLSQLVSSIIPINVHYEGKLRIGARSLIQFIVGRVAQNQVVPLSNVITAHLCCGLSHIDTDIQLDSLKLLDIIIESSPLVIIEGHHQILPNCLDQVALKTRPSDQSRSLNKNVNSKVTALQWRTEVLQRVLKILKIVEGKTQAEDRKIKESPYEKFYFGLVKTPTEPLALGDILNYRSSKDSSETFNLKNFLAGLYELLFQTWCEAIAIDKKKQYQTNLVSSAVLPTLQVIVELLVVQEATNQSKLLNHMLKSFPLELLPDKKNEGKENVNEINLNICLLVSQQQIPEVLDYVSKFTVSSHNEATKIASILMKLDKVDIMEDIIQQLVSKFIFNQSVTEALLYLTLRNQLSCLDTWIQELPKALMSPKVQLNHTEAVKALFKRRNVVLNEAFSTLKSYEVPGSSHIDQVWRTLVLFPMEKEAVLKAIKSDENVSETTKRFVLNKF